MILPASYETVLFLIVLTVICWGSWANTLKAAGKWRFELYYLDFSLGALLTATIAGFTFGSMGEDLSFIDNLSVARNLYIGYSFAAGLIFNLANVLLLAAVGIAGMSVAFPIAIGIALAIGAGWMYLGNAQEMPALSLTGIVLVLFAAVAGAGAYSRYLK